MSKPLTVEILLNSAIRFISYRQRSVQEVEARLRKKYGALLTDELLELLLQRLAEFNLLNDADFAAEYIHSKMRMGKGPLIIGRELSLKGVDKAIIEARLQQVDFDEWLVNATLKLSKRIAAIRRKPAKQQKQAAYAYLYGRGYPADIIRAAIDEVGV